MTEKTREPQYQRVLDLRDEYGLARLGLMTNQDWLDDPRHVLFKLSRYKFVAKMLSGMRNVLEIGCADAFAAPIVLQDVEHLTAIDFDAVLIEDANELKRGRWEFDCKTHDILSGPVEGEFEGAYSLDVLEHIPQDREHDFVANIAKSLADHGVLILGTPNLQSQVHASALSKQGHINCKDHNELRDLMSCFFHNVFIFSMNDEVVHTGFYPMAHYLFALCCSKKSDVE